MCAICRQLTLLGFLLQSSPVGILQQPSKDTMRTDHYLYLVWMNQTYRWEERSQLVMLSNKLGKHRGNRYWEWRWGNSLNTRTKAETMASSSVFIVYFCCCCCFYRWSSVGIVTAESMFYFHVAPLVWTYRMKVEESLLMSIFQYIWAHFHYSSLFSSIKAHLDTHLLLPLSGSVAG